MSITPSFQQAEAIYEIGDWFKNSPKPFFYLAGYAGSGKSSIATLAVEACGLDPEGSEVKYAAYTGKASMVMTRKGMDANTVHSLIYTLKEDKLGELIFGLNWDSELRDAKLLVLDECSMIGDDIAEDLLRFNVKILVLGDPGQLEPIKGAKSGYFTRGTPDYFLSEIHRQALENSIIRLSQDIRNDVPIPMGDHGGVIKMRFDELSDLDLIAADQVLTGKNETRWGLNQLMMKAEGFEVGYPMLPGIKVICLKNNQRNGLFNGMIGRTTHVVDASMIDVKERYITQGVQVEEGIRWRQQFGPKRLHMGAFQDNWSPRTDDEKRMDLEILDRSYQEHRTDDNLFLFQFDLGYAVTVHKSQGSQWDSVVLVDDQFCSFNRQSRKRWLYTAMTRAVDTFVWAV